MSEGVDVAKKEDDKKDGCLTIVLLLGFFVIWSCLEFLKALPHWSRRAAGKREA